MRRMPAGNVVQELGAQVKIKGLGFLLKMTRGI